MSGPTSSTTSNKIIDGCRRRQDDASIELITTLMLNTQKMHYLHPVTPAEVNATLATLCAELAPGVQPFHVDVRPLPDAPANECFALVEDQVSAFGGTRLLGWSLWEMPGLFVEAEFHAVWKSPADEYIDIAPKARPTARILFLPSPEAVYSGRQVNNERRPVGNDPDVERYLHGFDLRYEFMNRGKRAEQFGEIELTGRDLGEYQAIERHLEQAHQKIAHKFPRVDSYLPCWCGSGKKTKWCHKLK